MRLHKAGSYRRGILQSLLSNTPALACPRRILAHVSGDAVYPALKMLPFLERAQPAVGSQESLLRNVLRLGRLETALERQGVHDPPVTLYQHAKGLAVPSEGLTNQVSIQKSHAL